MFITYCWYHRAAHQPSDRRGDPNPLVHRFKLLPELSGSSGALDNVSGHRNAVNLYPPPVLSGDNVCDFRDADLVAFTTVSL